MALSAVARANKPGDIRRLVEGGDAPISSQSPSHPLAAADVSLIDSNCWSDADQGDTAGLTSWHCPVYLPDDTAPVRAEK